MTLKEYKNKVRNETTPWTKKELLDVLNSQRDVKDAFFKNYDFRGIFAVKLVNYGCGCDRFVRKCNCPISDTSADCTSINVCESVYIDLINENDIYPKGDF
jgi:hypothetical protein